MTLELWLAYVGTVLLLMITPGPSQLLMLSNSISHGFPKSGATAAGDLSANTLQMVVASVGLASILYASQYTFVIIKWLGVAYLIYIGVRKFFSASSTALQSAQSEKSLRALYMEGFVTSASNPKAIIFFAALFPQFINPAAPAPTQFLLLGITYILIDGSFLSVYGAFASWIRQRLEAKIAPHLNRISGGFMMLAGVLLAFKRVKRQ